MTNLNRKEWVKHFRLVRDKKKWSQKTEGENKDVWRVSTSFGRFNLNLSHLIFWFQKKTCLACEGLIWGRLAFVFSHSRTATPWTTKLLRLPSFQVIVNSFSLLLQFFNRRLLRSDETIRGESDKIMARVDSSSLTSGEKQVDNWGLTDDCTD